MAKAEKLDETVARLREQILRGDYGVRGLLPSRSSLEQEFGISHSVMNQVILQLQGEGLITAGNGNRRLMATPPRKRVPMRDTPFTRFLRDQGLEPVTEYLETPGRLPMDENLAKAFGVPTGTLYVARRRRDGTKSIHYRLTSKYFLSELIDDETLVGMQVNNQYDAILDIKRKKGISAKFMAEDTISCLPTADEQERLGIARTAPVMEVTRTCYDQKGGRVIWLNRIVVVASLFVMHYEYEGEALWQALQEEEAMWKDVSEEVVTPRRALLVNAQR
jgi:DNA-binding GntR family transcriptional regulator